MNCIDLINKLDDLDKLVLDMNLMTFIDMSLDCSFWFSDYGDYSRLTSPEEKGYTLTKLIDINYEKLGDLEERQQKLERIIGSLFKIPPFHEVQGSPTDLEKDVMRLYFDAMVLYSKLNEKYIKLVNNSIEKYQEGRCLWKFKGDILYKFLKPYGELMVEFTLPSDNQGYPVKEVTIDGKTIQYNAIRITDTYLKLSCIIQRGIETGEIYCNHLS